MLTEQLYAIVNACMKEVSGAEMDSIVKLRLECLFIRLKRQIISASCRGNPDFVTTGELQRLQELSRQIAGAVDKNKAIADLEGQIAAVGCALNVADFPGPEPL